MLTALFIYKSFEIDQKTHTFFVYKFNKRYAFIFVESSA